MNGDCAFRIGRSHAVCQDYAISGGGEQPFVIVSDGCSSSPDTDLGARLLARVAAGALRAGAAELELERWVRKAGRMAAQLGVSSQCLDATLLIARAEGERWQVLMAGDGVATWEDLAGRVHVQALSYTGGYPEYPSYLASLERRRSYADLVENRAELRHLVIDPEGCVLADTNEQPGSGPYRAGGLIRDTRWLALLSDGATSFVAREETAGGGTSSKPLGLAPVLRELLQFKSFQGVFVQRRMARFSARSSQLGWGHEDDLSLAALYLGQ